MNVTAASSTIATGRKALANALADAWVYDENALVEELIHGREFTVGILGDQALPVIELVPHHAFFDNTSKYDGSTDYIFDSDVPPAARRAMADVSLAAHKALGLRDFSRVDLILSREGEPVVLEANSIPGLTDMSLLPKAAGRKGIAFPELCSRLVRRALARGRRNR